MFRRHIVFTLLLIAILLIGCSDEQSPTQAPDAGMVETTSPGQVTIDGSGDQPSSGGTALPDIPTPIPPTPTPVEPMAALVNGQPIFLVEYEQEVARYEQAQAELGTELAGQDDAVDYHTIVLDALIEKELIAQAAAASGIIVTAGEADDRLNSLVEEIGGQENLDAWLQTNGWTEVDFQAALKSEMVTERMVELVTAGVPTAVEQVRASYIQIDDPTVAQSIVDQIAGGADFATLARQHSLDRVTGDNGGDLGFFASGSLLVPEVEAAAFGLQVGEVSGIIEGVSLDGSATTYYVVTVVERDPERTLTADLRYELLQEAFGVWLNEIWSQAEISRFPEPQP